MIDTFLQIVAPHHCYGCGIAGLLLCDNCKYNIVDERFPACVVCQRPHARHGVCHSCKTSYERAWVVSERSDEVEQLLNGYKFMRQKSGAKVCVELLESILPVFSGMDITVVPVPTISTHIRRRGYDHTVLIAKNLARRRKLPYSAVLSRQTDSVQLGSSKRERFENAKHAFRVTKQLDPDVIYLVIDDVVTTGATLQFAAEALRKAGASNVWVAAIARQPLDKRV